ncbi:aspartic proteinase CDR1-like [Typha angustifolia]|uniref:aspartic proteinase CDR1-like n=1 Tax=Typha angustifolia TaxID=59011 RepID=UPI003C305AF8
MAAGRELFARGGFSIELNRRDSIKSPLYDPSKSLFDRIRDAARRSQARAELLSRSFLPSSSSSNGSFNFDLIGLAAEYYMTFHVGTPPREIVAIADTGSDLVWANCKPCDHCYEQKDPLFDPSNSTSYINLSCDSASCSDLPAIDCAPRTDCKYIYSYGDSSQTIGNLANETFTFDATSGNSVRIPDITFGCSHETTGTFNRMGGGLVGLGAGELSLISQLGPTIDHKFSYCLLPFTETKPSQLRFGADAVVSGDNAVTTSFTQAFAQSFYAVSLNGVAIGNEKIHINSSNMIVDSGTTLTHLDPRVLDPLSDAIVRAVGLPSVEDPEGLFSVCFNTTSKAANPSLPSMTIQLGTAAVKLESSNVFVVRTTNVECLAILPGQDGLSILGNIAQSNFHVGYDIKEKTITFAKTDCSALESFS